MKIIMRHIMLQGIFDVMGYVVMSYNIWSVKIAKGNFPKFSLNSGSPLEQYSASEYEYGAVWKVVIALQLQVYGV